VPSGRSRPSTFGAGGFFHGKNGKTYRFQGDVARTAYWSAWAALGPGERDAGEALPTAQALAQRKVLLLLNAQEPGDPDTSMVNSD